MKFLKKMVSSKKITVLVLAFLLANLFDPTAIVFATDDTASDLLKGFGEIASVFVNMLTFISILFLNYGGKLMGTDLLTGDQVMEAIRPMWVIMRNFTNIGFVIMMIFLSVANLFSSFGEGGNWTIKDKLPKIIFALVAINFSLLGFRVVIDAVHVGTIAILSVSDSIMAEQGSNKAAAEVMMNKMYDEEGTECFNESDTCKTFVGHINGVFCPPLVNPTAEAVAKEDKCTFALNKKGFSTDPQDQSARNLFMAFGIQFQHLQQLPKLAAELNSWTQVISSTLFSTIMALAFVVAIVALFIVLLFRIVVLWLGMVFSPFLVAGAIMDIGDGDTGIAKKIITNLLVPLKVAAVFAVTFVLISALSTIKIKTGINGEGESFIFLGPALSKLGNEYSILWQIMTVIVFWTAAFKAMEGSAAESIVNKVKSGAQTMGGYVAKSQTIDKPILPWFGGKDISLTTLMKTPKALEDAQGQKMSREYQQIVGQFGGDKKSQKSLDDINRTLKKVVDGKDLSNPQIKDILGSEKNIETLKANEGLRTKFLEKVPRNMKSIVKDAFKGHTKTADITNALKTGLANSGVETAGIGKTEDEAKTLTPTVKMKIQQDDKNPLNTKLTMIENDTEMKITPQQNVAKTIDEINVNIKNKTGLQNNLKKPKEFKRILEEYVQKSHPDEIVDVDKYEYKDGVGIQLKDTSQITK